MCLLCKHLTVNRPLNEAVTRKKQYDMINNLHETVVKIVLSIVNLEFLFSD